MKQMHHSFSQVSLDSLKVLIDNHINTSSPQHINQICAVRITGEFSEIITRSVYVQKKPYPTIEEVVKEEVRKTSHQISGTAIGFRAPEPSMNILWPGYHFHFLSSDEKMGGHIHQFMMEHGTVELDYLDKVDLRLPGNQ